MARKQAAAFGVLFGLATGFLVSGVLPGVARACESITQIDPVTGQPLGPANPCPPQSTDPLRPFSVQSQPAASAAKPSASYIGAQSSQPSFALKGPDQSAGGLGTAQDSTSRTVAPMKAAQPQLNQTSSKELTASFFERAFTPVKSIVKAILSFF